MPKHCGVLQELSLHVKHKNIKKHATVINLKSLTRKSLIDSSLQSLANNTETGGKDEINSNHKNIPLLLLVPQNNL